MESKKNIFLKKNDGKRVVVKCIEGCKLHMMFSKRVGNQYWKVVGLFDDHTCHKITYNRQATTK